MSFTQSNHLSTDAYNSIPVGYNNNSITDGYTSTWRLSFFNLRNHDTI